MVLKIVDERCVGGILEVFLGVLIVILGTVVNPSEDYITRKLQTHILILSLFNTTYDNF